MKNTYRAAVVRPAVALIVLAGAAFAATAEDAPQSVSITTVTNVAGTITQANYGEAGGTVQSFLVGTNILLTFPTTVCSGVGSLGAAGNSVTYSGSAVTFASGFQSVTVSSFTNNTTKATYSKSSVVSKPAAYPATAGTISQLNYASEGTIDGFLFAPTGGAAKIFVFFLQTPSATLAPLLKVGSAVSVTGTQEAAVACAPAGTPAEVYASTLTFGTTVVNPGFGHGGKM